MAFGLMRSDDLVPFAMKLIRVKIESLHFLLGDFATGWIFAAIQAARHFQSFGGRRLGNEMDDRFVVTQWLATPIRRDEGKEAVLDLVPLAGPGRKMTDRNGQACVIGEVLQLQLPQAQPPAIASPS